MMNVETIFMNAIDHWRDNKGVGTALIPKPFNDKYMIACVLQKMYNKKNYTDTLIIVNNFAERKDIIEYLSDYDDKLKSLLDNKSIKVYTVNYVDNYTNTLTPYVTVWYHCETICENVFDIVRMSKFKLIILNKLSLSSQDINKLYSIAPLLEDFKQFEIDELRTSTPVEEIQIGINIATDSEEYKLLDYYNNYISTSINIFGSFDNIEYARVGNKSLNMSSTAFCNTIAIENGWNEHLDMSVEINQQIDAFYNPANIRERAHQTYQIMRERKELICNHKDKLEKIANIVKENSDKRILIINKFAEFASVVTNYLNNVFDKEVCANYHDKVDPIPAVTLDGQPILVKSGSFKGEQKMYHATAQKSYNEARFNEGIINILSTNNSPDKNLNIPIDIIIITSPECEEIKSYLYRLNNVYFPNELIKLYTIYINDTFEDKKLQNKVVSNNHNIIEKNRENCNFIVAD